MIVQLLILGCVALLTLSGNVEGWLPVETVQGLCGDDGDCNDVVVLNDKTEEELAIERARARMKAMKELRQDIKHGPKKKARRKIKSKIFKCNASEAYHIKKMQCNEFWAMALLMNWIKKNKSKMEKNEKD